MRKKKFGGRRQAKRITQEKGGGESTPFRKKIYYSPTDRRGQTLPNHGKNRKSSVIRPGERGRGVVATFEPGFRSGARGGVSGGVKRLSRKLRKV